MRVTIVGVGLIGGSMAIDLKKSGFAHEIIGVDISEVHLEQALKLEIIDYSLTLKEATSKSDMVVLALPVSAVPMVIREVLENLPENGVVFDTGSTKAQICKQVREHPHRNKFVASHPIAGTENSGPGSAFSGLFKDKTNIVCEKESSSPHALGMAEKAFGYLGLKTIYMDPVEHDKHVAYVSHLSHVSSFLLGQTVLDIEKDEKNIFNLAGSGFASTVRLAKSSPDMWAPIFEQNAEYLSQALLEYIMHLQRFQYFLMKRDVKQLHRIMSDANHIREVLNGIEQQQKKEIEKVNDK